MRDKMRLGAVIPAAGLSSRMGRFKPLLPCGDSTVIEASVGTALDYADTAAAVLGNRADELRKLLCESFGDSLVLAYNPDYAATDMLASVKIGLRQLGDCDAFFLVPADMPMISPKTYSALIEAFDGTAEVLVPSLNGRRGHPPLISAALIPEILESEGSGGLKAVFSRHTVRVINVSDKGILTDLDTPGDLDKLTR